MRNLVRMFAASVLLILALTAAPKSSEASCSYCWQSGDCTYCVDQCFGDCIYMCPWGDGRC
jgi:hypothetical protein